MTADFRETQTEECSRRKSRFTRFQVSADTFGPAVNANPVWAPDGARIIFRTNRTAGLQELYGKSAGGGGIEEPVLSQTAVRASGATVRKHGAVGLVSGRAASALLGDDGFGLRLVAGGARGRLEAGEFSDGAGRSVARQLFAGWPAGGVQLERVWPL